MDVIPPHTKSVQVSLQQKMKTGYTVADCMTEDPLTTGPEITIKDAAKLMKKRKLGSIVILKKDKPIGIVTNQDLVFRVIAKGYSAKNPIEKVMSTSIVQISPNLDIFEALDVMNKNMIRHLNVVSRGKLVGYITLKDILKIEPALFDLYADKIDARLQGDNNLNPLYDNDGICGMCGSYAKRLFNVNGTEVCTICKKKK